MSSPREPVAPAPAIVQPITRALAELQTRIVSEGVRAFDGWLERFVVFTLITRLSGLVEPGSATPISVNALSASLNMPYETTRRHVNALVADGLCVRSPSRLLAARDGLARPHIAHLIRQTHDAFVRFVEDLAATGEPLPPPDRRTGYETGRGVELAADILLAVIATNSDTHARWVDLSLFSTVVAANCRAGPLGPDPIRATEPVTSMSVARAMAMRPATVARHLTAMTHSGQLRHAREGYLVNGEWLSQPRAQAVTQESLANVRRLLRGLARHGFPFDDPARAFIGERPAPVPIG